MRQFPLNAPPWMSASVISQINYLLPSMVSSVSPSLKEMIKGLLGPVLLRPFRPFWAVPDEDGVLEWIGDDVDNFLDYYSSISPSQDECSGGGSNSGSCSGNYGDGNGDESHLNCSPYVNSPLEYTPLVLLSCSPVRSDSTHSACHSWKYIQGAGDDEENWSSGLSAEIFWGNKDHILESDDPKEVCTMHLLLFVSLLSNIRTFISFST